MVTKPKSRGFVKLRSANPADMPIVSPHLLKHPDDMATMIAGQRFFLRAFAERAARRPHRRVSSGPTRPTSATRRSPRTASSMVKTNYHPAGTARMGADGDRMAVLDAAMRVRGIDNLRVADMSACPNINCRQHRRAGDDAGRPLRRLRPRRPRRLPPGGGVPRADARQVASDSTLTRHAEQKEA